MPGMMFIPPQQRSNPALNMGMNMLGQMALAQYAQKMRAEEAAKERTLREEHNNQIMDTQLALKGFEPLPEDAAVPPGSIKVGKKYYKQGEIKPVPVKDGDKLIGYAINQGGEFKFIENPKEKPENKATSIKEYEYGKEDPEYAKWLEKHNASKAIRIGIDEKVNTQEAMKDVDRRSFIQTAAWDKQVADVAQERFDKDTWDEMPVWKREQEIFNSADTDLKTVYKEWNPYFGTKDGVQGWYGKNPKTKKFEVIKRWGKEKTIGPQSVPTHKRLF